MINIDPLAINDKSPEYYQYYPRLFTSYFKSVDLDTVGNLSKAGYIYYHSILCLDSVIDDKVFANLPKMIMLQERSIKILTSIYELDSSFWDFWDKRKNEYFEGVKIERLLSKTENIDFKIYEDLADKKSAFGKVAIDSLYVLYHL